jgi:predicted RNA-binding protein with PIN domain
MHPLVRGLCETAGVVAGFVAFGLSWASLAAPERAAPPRAAPPAYAPEAMDQPAPQRPIWLVDGYNALCAGLLGGRDRGRWWSAERRGELLTRLESFEDPDAEIWVVFDGSCDPGAAGGERGRVRTVFSPCADAWLVRQVQQRAAGQPVSVVTDDRQVADRARHRGAEVVSPRAFLGRCSGGPDSDGARS